MKENAGLGPVITDIEGLELSPSDREVLRHPKLGGLIFFSRNYESKAQLVELVRSIRELRKDILLTVDHEGGRVQRFRDGFSAIPPMATLGLEYHQDSEKAMALAYAAAWVLAYELTVLGIDHSYAPVLDLDTEFSKVIGDRSFSKKAEVTSRLAEQFIAGMRAAGMSATAKHFPGHGSVEADSHYELPVDTRPFDEIYEHDLQPFIRLKDRYQSVMTAHVSFPDVDERPVSFSKKWIKGILREKIAYGGIVLSDDLSMKASSSYGDMRQRAVSALNAGCDAILICNARPEAEGVLEYLEAHALGEHNKLLTLACAYNQTELRAKNNEYGHYKNQVLGRSV